MKIKKPTLVLIINKMIVYKVPFTSRMGNFVF